MKKTEINKNKIADYLLFNNIVDLETAKTISRKIKHLEK